MKALPALLLLVSLTTAHAQDSTAFYSGPRMRPVVQNIDPQALDLAGRQLQGASRNILLGIGLQALGLIAINSSFQGGRVNGGLVTVGSLAVLGGFVVQLTGFGKIGKAGRALRTQAKGPR